MQKFKIEDLWLWYQSIPYNSSDPFVLDRAGFWAIVTFLTLVYLVGIYTLEGDLPLGLRLIWPLYLLFKIVFGAAVGLVILLKELFL